MSGDALPVFGGTPFRGPVPLFPLPNLVLFPHVVQPLHMFEPRYKQMTAHALADQGLIATALMCPGWEKDYYGRPQVFPTVCVGKIIAHEQVEEGKFNLLLQGMLRARVTAETRQDLYRVALLERLEEKKASEVQDAFHRSVLTDLFTRGSLSLLPLAESVRDLLEGAVPTPTILDVLAFALVPDVATKQRLLEELDPVARGEELIDHLIELSRTLENVKVPKEPGDWPPRLDFN